MLTGDIGKVRIGDITLSYRKNDGGGTHYLGRSHAEEYLSPIYPLLQKELSPQVCLDIGANYGYTGLLMRRAFPDSRLTLVEPIPWLADFIRHNFETNGESFDRLCSAIASAGTDGARSSFGVNERGTQDSRVIPQPGTSVIETDVVTIDNLTKDVAASQGTYIKIDTQGWEERVLAGASGFLSRHDRWFIKAEFAPQWLESQGTDPVALLRRLIASYAVHESPGRQRWNCATLAEAIGAQLRAGDEEAFVHYVRNLAIQDKGWVDIYILPPPERRAYATIVEAGASRMWRRLFRKGRR